MKVVIEVEKKINKFCHSIEAKPLLTCVCFANLIFFRCKFPEAKWKIVKKHKDVETVCIRLCILE